MIIKEPFRKKFTGYQTWHAPMNVVFPLLCPVEQTKWTPGWNPKEIFTNSEVIETDSIFITPHSEDEAIWIVSVHDPINYHIEMYQVIPKLLVQKYEITLFDEVDGNSKAEITYLLTAISNSGINSVKEFSKDKFDLYMLKWEKALNYYLKNNEMIPRSMS
jgi:hypothetical protein